jgi:hypothetical protein
MGPLKDEVSARGGSDVSCLRLPETGTSLPESHAAHPAARGTPHRRAKLIQTALEGFPHQPRLVALVAASTCLRTGRDAGAI